MASAFKSDPGRYSAHLFFPFRLKFGVFAATSMLYDSLSSSNEVMHCLTAIDTRSHPIKCQCICLEDAETFLTSDH